MSLATLRAGCRCPVVEKARNPESNQFGDHGHLDCLSCSRQSPDEPQASAVAYSSAAQLARQLGPGAFRVTGLGTTESGASRYLATIDGPPMCQFQVWIEKSNQEGMPFSFADAALLRQPGSDCTAYLRELAKQLGFRGELPRPAPADRLAASVAILGTSQSRSADADAGTFSSTPAGHWLVTKLFLANGEGEVYLNINARDGVGEFSIKDEEYATIVVTQLAKILLRSPG